MSTNKNRKTKQGTCLYCKNSFLQYTFANQIYCSQNCRSKYLKSLRPVHNCIICSEEIQTTKYRHTRNEEYYCSRKCYNRRKKDTLKRIKRHTEYFMDLVSKGCNCGVTEYYLLQVHHKDGNVNNNHPDNHEIVCANCHIKRHLKLNKNSKLVYHTKTLTSPEILNSLLSPLKLCV